MRTVGIDLGVSAAHKAIVVDEYGQFVTSPITFHTQWEEIEKVIVRAREGVTPDYPLRAVLEPTGMAWYPVSVALDGQGVLVYMVSGQKTHDLRRFYKRHSSSDRISARVLAKMPFVDGVSMYPLEIPSDTHLACQRGCKELDRLQIQVAAIKNRLRDTDRFAWPGLESIFKNIYSPSVRFFRETWYDPAHVVAAGAEKVRRTFKELSDPRDDLHWVDYLVKLAAEVRQLYGSAPPDYAMLQEEIAREQKQLADLEERAETVWQRTVRPLYRQLHPGRHLESLLGVGELSAAIYTCYIGRAGRFPDNRHFRGWHGMIPDSRQSGDA